MRTKLTDEVSVQEMLTMRERGMGNSQIAESLKTSYATVRKYIGNQPKGMRVYRDKPSTPKADKDNGTNAITIALIDKIERYEGNYGTYAINTKSVTIDGITIATLTKKDLERYITELIDVMGHME